MKLVEYARSYLTDEIAEIRNSDRKECLTQLSVEEKAFVYKYSLDGYKETNRLLRTEKRLDEFGTHLKSVLLKMENYVGVVYRGVNLKNTSMDKYYEAFRNEKPIEEASFLSTSKNILIGSGFSSNTLFEIFSLSGKNIDELSAFGMFTTHIRRGNEEEVLFLPNRRFRILDIQKQAKAVVMMEEIV